MPNLPLLWTEFNASYMNEPEVTDSTYMGPWLADTIRQCEGLVDEMSYWTFSDVFEEQGVVKQPFYGGYGLIAAGGIPKPAFNAFLLLHQLGEQRLNVSSDSVLVTRRRDGTVIIAAWNVAPVSDTAGAPKKLIFEFRHGSASKVEVTRLDPAHGDVHTAYETMGSPRYPTREQIEKLRAAAWLSPPETYDVKNGSVTLAVPVHGLVLLEVKNSR
jgi:xylan 1,4-beta-xylosidase